MKCDFCDSKMILEEDDCIFCDGNKCEICDNTGKLNIASCSNDECRLERE